MFDIVPLMKNNYYEATYEAIHLPLLRPVRIYHCQHLDDQ